MACLHPGESPHVLIYKKARILHLFISTYAPSEEKVPNSPFLTAHSLRHLCDSSFPYSLAISSGMHSHLSDAFQGMPFARSHWTAPWQMQQRSAMLTCDRRCLTCRLFYDLCRWLFACRWWSRFGQSGRGARLDLRRGRLRECMQINYFMFARLEDDLLRVCPEHHRVGSWRVEGLS